MLHASITGLQGAASQRRPEAEVKTADRLFDVSGRGVVDKRAVKSEIRGGGGGEREEEEEEIEEVEEREEGEVRMSS